MERIEVLEGTAIISASTAPMMLSIEGSPCRLYMGEVPADLTAGHSVEGGYQLIVPAGVDVFGTTAYGGTFAVVGPFGE